MCKKNSALYNVGIPCLVNTVSVTKGVELLVHRREKKAAPTVKRHIDLVTEPQAAKKNK